MRDGVRLNVLLQVTTHSRLLIMSDVGQLAKLIGLKRDAVVLHSLQAFDTEQQFCKMLKYVFTFHLYYCTLLCVVCTISNEVAVIYL